MRFHKTSALFRNPHIAFVFLMLLLLSGCMYPNEQRKENQINPSEFIAVVQNAVDQFHTRTGVLPIKNSEMDTPIYEKYMIDFQKLQRSKYLSNIPANAFENGGTFIYVLVHVETKPEVKLMDLSAYQNAAEVQKKVDDYASKHNGQIPKGEGITSSFYYLDFQKLGIRLPKVKSVFNSQSFVNYIISESGKVALDYAPDLMKIIQTQGLDNQLKPEQDLRELLVTSSYFVPARSYFYHWSKGQPLPSHN